MASQLGPGVWSSQSSSVELGGAVGASDREGQWPSNSAAPWEGRVQLCSSVSSADSRVFATRRSPMGTAAVVPVRVESSGAVAFQAGAAERSTRVRAPGCRITRLQVRKGPGGRATRGQPRLSKKHQARALHPLQSACQLGNATRLSVRSRRHVEFGRGDGSVVVCVIVVRAHGCTPALTAGGF